MKKSFLLPVLLILTSSFAFSQSQRASKHTLDSLQILKWNWDSLKVVFDSKRVYSYDVNENMTKETLFEWDLFSSTWDSLETFQYTYNTSNNPTTYIHTILASQQIRKWDYTYDSNDNLILEKKSIYYNNSQWVNKEKTEFTYNTSNKVLLSMYYKWNNNMWLLYTKEETLYNSSNNPTTKTVFTWNVSNSSWGNFKENRYTYDSSQNIKLDSTLFWVADSNSWFANTSLAYDYDSNGNIIMLTYSGYAGTIGWQNNKRYSWSYDTYGNEIENVIESWQNDTNWAVHQEIQSKYNNNYQKPDLILPYSIPSTISINSQGVDVIQPDFNHMLNENLILFWDFNNAKWIEQEKRWYFYSGDIVNSVSELPVENTSVYPNPFTSHVSFQIPNNSNSFQLKIYNLQGRLMLNKRVSSTEVVNLDYLSSGIYIYHLITKTQQLKGKIVKQL